MINRLLQLIKFNLLWLFKYRCKIPPGKYFAVERIEPGTVVCLVNDRLHLIRGVKSYIPNPFGIVTDGDNQGNYDIITQAYISGLISSSPVAPNAVCTNRGKPVGHGAWPKITNSKGK